MGLFGFLRPQFCHRNRRDVIRELMDSNQEVRRVALREAIGDFKLRVSHEKHRREAAELVNALMRVRPDFSAALEHKRRSSHSLVLWISSQTPNAAAIMATPEFRALNTALNAVEWAQQLTSTFETMCSGCQDKVSVTPAKPGALGKCPRCEAQAVRWFYSAEGEPVAYLSGEHVFRKSGAHLGSLEANQVWSFDYEGEILLDDRIMYNYFWAGPRRNGYDSVIGVQAPIVPPSKRATAPPPEGGLNNYVDI